MKRHSHGIISLFVVLTTAVTFWGCQGNAHSESPEKSLAGAAKAGLEEPNVTFKDLDGKDVPLSSFKGKVVVLNFWATWCEPCQIEIPWMIEFQDKYASKGFTMLGVAMDEEGKSAVAPFVQKSQFDEDGKKEAMNYPIVLGNDDIASKFGGLIGLPTTIVISRDGRIVKRFIGLADHDTLEKQIQSLL